MYKCVLLLWLFRSSVSFICTTADFGHHFHCYLCCYKLHLLLMLLLCDVRFCCYFIVLHLTLRRVNICPRKFMSGFVFLRLLGAILRSAAGHPSTYHVYM